MKIRQIQSYFKVSAPFPTTDIVPQHEIRNAQCSPLTSLKYNSAHNNLHNQVNIKQAKRNNKKVTGGTTAQMTQGTKFKGGQKMLTFRDKWKSKETKSNKLPLSSNQICVYTTYLNLKCTTSLCLLYISSKIVLDI